MSREPERHKPVTFPLYIDRWIAATRHLTPAARGIYLDWLTWCWAHNRPLPNAPGIRASIAACTIQEVEAVWETELAEHWRAVPGGFVNESLERKRQNRDDFYASQLKKAKAGAAARWKGHTPKRRQSVDAPGNAPAHQQSGVGKSPKKWTNENGPRYAPGNARGNARGNAPAMPSILRSRSRSLEEISAEQRSGSSELDPQIKKDHRAGARHAHVNGTKVQKTTENPRLLLKFAIEVVRKPNTTAEWVAQLKDIAAAHGLAYTGQAVHRAISRAEKVVSRERGGGRSSV